MTHLASALDDYDVACLDTERVSFYERLGWERWRGPLAGRSDDGLIPTRTSRASWSCACREPLSSTRTRC